MILSFPSLILAMIINAVMGSNLFNTMFALVIVSWPTYARLMRSVVLSVKENEYVNAAEALGASRMRIPFKRDHPKQRQLRIDHGYHRYRKQDTDVLYFKLLGTWFRPANTGMGNDGF